MTFGCGRLVALWCIDVKLALFLRTLINHAFPQDPDDHGVYETLPGHESTVTCVQFLHDAFFFSADEKGVVQAWRKGESEVRVYYRTSQEALLTDACRSKWVHALAVQAHRESISALTSFNDLLVTGSSDSSVKIWKIEQGEKGLTTLLSKAGDPIKAYSRSH